jgi:hypothetical protein
MSSISSENARQITHQALGAAIVHNRGQLIALLRKHGVNISESYPNSQLTVAILVATREKPRFRQDLAALLESVTKTQTKNFTAEKGMQFFFTADRGEQFSNTANRFFYNADGEDKTAAGKYLQDNLGTILNTGLGTISTLLTNKSNAKLADKALAIEAEKTRQAELAAQLGAQAGALGGTVKPGLSTGAKVAIGVGVAAVLGTIIYFIVKK